MARQTGSIYDERWPFDPRGRAHHKESVPPDSRVVVLMRPKDIEAMFEHYHPLRNRYMREIDALEADGFDPDNHNLFGPMGGLMKDAYNTENVEEATRMARKLFEQCDHICGALQAALLP